MPSLSTFPLHKIVSEQDSAAPALNSLQAVAPVVCCVSTLLHVYVEALGFIELASLRVDPQDMHKQPLTPCKYSRRFMHCAELSWDCVTPARQLHFPDVHFLRMEVGWRQRTF